MQRSLPTLVMFTVIGCLVANESSAQVVRQEIAGVTNFAKIESTVACAGAITPAAIAELKKMGYASIINLRLATEPGADIDRHIAAAKAVGIPYYHIPFSVTAPDPAAVDTFLRTITAPGVQPAFIH
jgi:protein tyrosine phosphatase (PTP) superfamily phosphohydrolase (DUF442 family)